MTTSAEAKAVTEREEFPQAARAHLDALYEARHVLDKPPAAKIVVLREVHNLQDAVITADRGINGEEETLRVLEFYHLVKFGMI